MSTPELTMPRGAQLIRFLDSTGPPWARVIPTAAGESLILHGDPGSGIEEAGDWLAEATLVDNRPVVYLSVSLIGDYQTLVSKLVGAMAVAAFGDEAAGDLVAFAQGERAEVPQIAPGRRAEFLRLAVAMRDADAGYARGAVADVLRVAPPGLLVVHDAHLLSERWSRNVLWEIRGSVQDARRHSVVLTCPTEARETLSGPRAPFYGAGAIAEVGAQRDDRMWTRVTRTHELKIDPEDLAFVLARTWGLARPTLEVLLDIEAMGARAALDRRVREAARTVPLVLRLARSVSRYGPELLLRLSRGLPPYGIPSATARDVSRALRQLGFHELVARVGRRGWRVADPFVADALLSRPLSSW